MNEKMNEKMNTEEMQKKIIDSMITPKQILDAVSKGIAEKRKVYISTQLAAVLPPIVLKVATYIANWSSSPNGIMLYEHYIGRLLNLTDDEVRIAVQSLINYKLISLEKVDDKVKINVNVQEWYKYMNIPIGQIINEEGLKMAESVVYDKEGTGNFSELKDEELNRLILMLQATLKQREMNKSIVDDLPF